MMCRSRRLLIGVMVCISVCFSASGFAQSQGTAGTIRGVVTDPSGGVVPGAAVQIHNPVSGHSQTVQTDAAGEFRILNVPPNPYHLRVSKDGFQAAEQDVVVRSSVPIELKFALQLAGTTTTVVVESGSADLIENTSTAHTDVDRSLAAQLPVESPSAALSAVVTLAAPGVVADSNGMFHPLGEHADTTFVVDNQPISDQQSKIYSNQVPLEAVESLEVITGAPPAEYGDKTSLTARLVTRSGQGLTKPMGSFGAQYGSFGTAAARLTLGLGGKRWGNFLAANGLHTGRFLDPPEFDVFHAKGNSQALFDRIDLQPTEADSLHLNVFVGRSWFQTPNAFDQQLARQDQRQLLRSWNVAPSWTHLFSPAALLSVGAFVRQDRARYIPSANLFADLPATIGQERRLTNAGIRADFSYVRGRHNAKFGGQFSHTFLTENFRLGLTDPAFNAVCQTATGDPITDPSLWDPAQCAPAGYQPNPDLLPGLVRFDLTRGGQLFAYRGRADIKQEAFYAQDTITLGSWALQAGLRVDNYNGLSRAYLFQPRAGVSYAIKRTGTVLRLSYARLFETPYNENLVLSSATGAGGLATNVFGAFAGRPLQPGRRHQGNAGFQQAFGKWAVVDADYFWKNTLTAFDFDTLFNTAIVFPIEWRKSKIDGFSIRVNVPEKRGFSAYTVLGHTRSRFFGPEIGGIIFNSPLAARAFRIDHDQAFQQTTHLQYRLPKKGPWLAFTWRYDSGLVAGRVPDFASALKLTAAQQSAIGLFCGNVLATRTSRITSCPAGTPSGATRIRIPAPGTANDDLNPPRVAPRHLLDAAAGMDNVFHTDRVRWNVRFSVLNLTNKVALYNFLSTFSGTHFVTPRTYQAEVGVSF